MESSRLLSLIPLLTEVFDSVFVGNFWAHDLLFVGCPPLLLLSLPSFGDLSLTFNRFHAVPVVVCPVPLHYTHK